MKYRNRPAQVNCRPFVPGTLGSDRPESRVLNSEGLNDLKSCIERFGECRGQYHKINPLTIES